MYYKNEPDDTLVMLTLAGEQTAYEVLVTRYQKAVVASAMHITKNHFMAEDAAQDAFVTAWMKLNTLQEHKKYCSWVCRIAKNCAINMMNRYRSFLPFDVVENLDISDDSAQNPAEIYALSEERNEVNKSVEMLPEKVRNIIRLHYFENLSIAEIADRMRISEGTVKWQLHDGRKRIRKELCAMNEKYCDTLVQRVMKKVEELKLWQLKNDKSGFEKVYKDVLCEVEDLPECTEKQHALADVLMRGWWWLPGKKNNALFARIVDSATEGKNEEVMTFIVAHEDSAVYGGAKIEFMRDKQIPRLEKAGFVKTLGREWFWLGYNLHREGRIEEGFAAYDMVEKILQEGDAYRALVPYARKMEEVLTTNYKEKSPNRYSIGAFSEEYRYIDRKPRFWKEECFGEGYMQSIDREVGHIFRNSSRCDGNFFADIAIGDCITGTDGTTLTYVSDSEYVETPAGNFENCQLWVTKNWNDNGKSIFKSYYKEGVGIVKHVHICDGIAESVVLKSYDVKNGKGLLPFNKGNSWEYACQYDEAMIISELKYTVSFVNEEKVLITSWGNIERLQYNESSWLEMISQIRNDYWEEREGRAYICDVSSAINRAKELAQTPMEKAHTKAAVSVANRIAETDPTFNPNHSATGHWNFFSRNAIQNKKGLLYLTRNFRWSFELKNVGSMGFAEMPILYNDIYGILQDAANCIWSDEWRIGASPIVEYTKWDRTVKTRMLCEDGGTIITKAGTFENCFKLCLDIGGMQEGWAYRGGKKVYYFADGIGIVRVENECYGGARTAVYELTSYEGTGDGFMPMTDGLVRRYDAIDLTDGFVGASEYSYVADDEGDIIICSDRTGIRELPPPITLYSAIQGETIEGAIYSSGNWQDGQIKYGVNNFHLFLHMLARPSRNTMDAKRSIELMSFYMGIAESFGEDGVPPAWYGLYAWMALVKSAACFGDNNHEEGYRSMDAAFDYCQRASAFKSGDLLETGKREIFGGIKYSYNNEYIQYPDGAKEPICYEYRMGFNSNNLYYIITAPSGWEWFDPVRNDERFKAYIEKAKKVANNN